MEEGDDTSSANTISSCYDNTDDIFRKYSQWGANISPKRPKYGVASKEFNIH